MNIFHLKPGQEFLKLSKHPPLPLPPLAKLLLTAPLTDLAKSKRDMVTYNLNY